MVDSGGNSSLC